MLSTLVLALLALRVVSVAVPSPADEEIDPVTGLFKPHYYEEVDLADYENLYPDNDAFEDIVRRAADDVEDACAPPATAAFTPAPMGNTTQNLDKRTQVTVCSHKTYDGQFCYDIGGHPAALIYTSEKIAKVFIGDSQANICDVSTYKIECTLNWVQHASNVDPDDDDCSTTAEQKTINGAMQNYLRSTGKICGVKCLRLSHGSGTWRGFVSLSGPDYNSENYACGPHSATVCYAGGEGDAHSNPKK